MVVDQSGWLSVFDTWHATFLALHSVFIFDCFSIVCIAFISLALLVGRQ